jgi:hypothetical protein
MAMTYTSLIADLPDWVMDESSEFAANMPTILERAQDRCWDAVIELEQLKTATTGVFVPGSPTVTRPADAVFFRLFTVTIGTERRILERRDASAILEMYGDDTYQTAPRYYAEDVSTQNQSLLMRVAPTPDQAYSYAIRYTRKPPYLAATSNESNWLTQFAPQMLQYACEVEAMLYKRHEDDVAMMLGAFGRAANDVRRRHGLNERDDFRALQSAMPTDNQGDYPVSMTQRMRQQPAQGS